MFLERIDSYQTNSGTQVRQGMGGESPPKPKTWPFRRAKMAVQCISAEQPTGPRTIGQLLFLKQEKCHSQKIFTGKFSSSDIPKKFSEVTYD